MNALVGLLLLAGAAAAQIADDLTKACSLADMDLHGACAPLAKITDEEIARLSEAAAGLG